MSGARVEVVGPIPKGGIVVFVNVRFGDEVDVEGVLASLTRAAGHDEYCVLALPTDDGDVEVWGPGVNVVARVNALLDEWRSTQEEPEDGKSP